MAGALAADVGERPGLLQRLAARAAWRQHHAVAQLRERQELRPFSGICTTSRLSMTSLISAVASAAAASGRSTSPPR